MKIKLFAFSVGRVFYFFGPNFCDFQVAAFSYSPTKFGEIIQPNFHTENLVDAIYLKHLLKKQNDEIANGT